MNDDKVEMMKDDKPTVLGKVEILVLSDGNVSVRGPVDNPVVMLNIFSKAMAAVANHVATKITEDMIVPQKPPIVSLN
jgi:hypothetical protein